MTPTARAYEYADERADGRPCFCGAEHEAQCPCGVLLCKSSCGRRCDGCQRWFCEACLTRFDDLVLCGPDLGLAIEEELEAQKELIGAEA